MTAMALTTFAWSGAGRCSYSDREPSVTEELTAPEPVGEIIAATGRPLPLITLHRYAKLGADFAEAEVLEEGDIFLQVPFMPGVWAQGATLREALYELREVIYEWAVLKIQDGDRDLPVIDGIDLNHI